MPYSSVRRRVGRWIRSPRVKCVAALVLIGGIVTLRAVGSHRAGVAVTTAAITSGPVVRHIVASGTLQAVTTVEVGAQVSGTIESLGADFNSIVHAGQVIARLDPALFAASLRQADASLQQAQAALLTAQAEQRGCETAVADARTQLRRAEELGARQLIPQADLDSARAAMDEASATLESAASQVSVAAAAVDRARAAANEAKLNLDHTIISSPIDGIVVARSVDVGQTVAAAMQAPVLFEIAADLRHMQLELDVDEADIAGVQPGEPVTFEVESYPDRTFAGTISSIRLQPVLEQTTGTSTTPAAAASTPQSATAATPSTGVAAPSVTGTVVSYATMVDVANADQWLRPGMTATVALTGARREQAVRAPSAALSFRPPFEVLTALHEPASVLIPADRTTDPTRRRLWHYDGTQFTPIDVRVGLADTEWTELVASSLHPGDVVVTRAELR